MNDFNNAVAISRDDQFLNISIYEFENSDVAGLFSNNRYGQNVVFDNIVSLILIIEDCMNKNAFPKPMSDYRKLENRDTENSTRHKQNARAEVCIPELAMPAEWEHEKPLKTFSARIVFRTLAGWQGEVRCIETGEDLQFKSDMEFIMFIINTLKSGKSERSA